MTDLGIHILYYASDIPAGEHELTAEERETLNASALVYYQNQELEKLMIDWREEYEIETHAELLDDAPDMAARQYQALLRQLAHRGAGDVHADAKPGGKHLKRGQRLPRLVVATDDGAA